MTRELWVRLGIAVGGVVLAIVVAKLVDRRIANRRLEPGTITRYRILRQSILWAIVFVGVLSALLVIPQVRALAAGILASGAVIGLVLGFAAQRTIGNFIAGLLIAFTQPVRLGDEIEIDGTRGVVEEIGLIYTWMQTSDNDRLAIPNEKLASDTIRNSTIRDPRRLAEVTVHVPLTADLRAAVSILEPGTDEVSVVELGTDATIAVRRYVDASEALEHGESELRVEISERLRQAGITGVGE
ncbi:MAG TPA: mechanosensitive ion channel domain-containing protein [Gaiellaceae bacterium]|jgi:small-conductance mechanosensitive channel|nr:mechanosensitive ion channel domain-containing protein [Gaiellaceae bacterium]